MTIRGVTGNALDVTGLTKAFGSHTVLHGIDLGVTAGTITAVVGASGCGKTTLLRLVAGFENPDAGTVSIAGRQVAAAGSSTPRIAATWATSRRTARCSRT